MQICPFTENHRKRETCITGMILIQISVCVLFFRGVATDDSVLIHEQPEDYDEEDAGRLDDEDHEGDLGGEEGNMGFDDGDLTGHDKWGGVVEPNQDVNEGDPGGEGDVGFDDGDSTGHDEWGGVTEPGGEVSEEDFGGEKDNDDGDQTEHDEWGEVTETGEEGNEGNLGDDSASEGAVNTTGTSQDGLCVVRFAQL